MYSLTRFIYIDNCPYADVRFLIEQCNMTILFNFHQLRFSSAKSMSHTVESGGVHFYVQGDSRVKQYNYRYTIEYE